MSMKRTAWAALPALALAAPASAQSNIDPQDKWSEVLFDGSPK